MRILATGFAAALAVSGAHAQPTTTVTITPPSYTIQPPAFRVPIPTITSVGVKSVAIANGHLIVTFTNGQTQDAGALPSGGGTTDLTAVNSAISTLQGQVSALQAAPPASTGGGGTPAPAPATLSDPCASGQHWDALTVDNSVNISAALACANPKFKLTLKPGTYNQVFHVPDGLDGWDIGGASAASVQVSGQGGCTVDQNNGSGCSTRLAWGKGVIHVSSAGTIHDIEVKDGGSNANGNHDGQAGIYIDAGAAGGTITVQHVMLRHNENGVFSNGNTQLDIVLTEDDFVNNGTDGGSHSSYLGGGKSVTYNNIHDYGSTQGNNAKSRIPVVTFNGGFSKSIQGRWIEAADGATMTINGGQFVGNNCCQNQFGNGTESTNKGPGNTTWHGPSDIWIFRNTDFANAGSFQADPNVTLHMCGSGPNPFNDKGGALNGWTVDGACTVQPPADPPFVSGAK